MIYYINSIIDQFAFCYLRLNRNNHITYRLDQLVNLTVNGISLPPIPYCIRTLRVIHSDFTMREFCGDIIYVNS